MSSTKADISIGFGGATLDLTILDRTGTYDYSWNEFVVMRGSDGALYVGASGGCSCNYFEENLEGGDLAKVSSWQDAAERAKRWAKGEDYRDKGKEDYYGGPYMEEEKRGAMNLVERLARDRPAAQTLGE